MMQNKEIFLLKLKFFLNIHVIDSTCQQIIYVLRLSILLAIYNNLQKRDSFIASKHILVFVPCNRKIFVCSKLCSHAKKTRPHSFETFWVPIQMEHRSSYLGLEVQIPSKSIDLIPALLALPAIPLSEIE